MDITEDKRKNEVELTAIKRAMRNTRWWKVFITVFMIAGIVAPVISIRAISTLQDMGSMLSAKYKEISVDKPGKQAALASVNKWLDTNKGPFRYGTTNLLWDSATKVGSSDEDTGTGKGIFRAGSPGNGKWMVVAETVAGSIVGITAQAAFHDVFFRILLCIQGLQRF